MSQAKVDAHKEEKQHRQEEVRKQKRNRILARVIGTLVAIAVVAWIGFSGYRYYQSNHEKTAIPIISNAIDDYMNTVD